ncbi:hypothetical protein [Flavobacterium hydrophilum]|uniref:Uncharacterized protein n=1 Tax=Flavobacterium hydrophilum TaxID=2211445 RepID=A0A2V4C680_9FLAO|nr:hypothetical protein [Flavobacterium hydrophilum]PXY46497.1 hypothetical protein DMB68_04800 [Flavobacterium hydrophilum]
MAEKDKKTARATSKKVAKKTIVEENNSLFSEDLLVSENAKQDESENKMKEVQLEITNNIGIEKTTEIEKNFNLKAENLNNSGFDFKKPLYLEIHRGNIFHYFASGLISPSQYISNRAFPDLQSIQKDALLFSNGCSNSNSDDIVLLEIQILKTEEKFFNIVDDFAFSFMPLPISRIRNIYVKKEIIKNSIVSDSLVFDGGYIPQLLIKVNYPSKLRKNKYDIVNQNVSAKEDHTSKINKFDRILGLLAFVKNYNILISEKTNSYTTISNHFFYAIQSIDSSFGCEIIQNASISEFYSWLFDDNCPSDKKLLKWLFERLDVLNNFNDNDTKEFEVIFDNNSNETEYEKIIRQVFFGLRKNIERKGVLAIIETMKSKSALPLYLFSYLRNYANLNSIEIARRDITTVFSSQFGEYAFAILGYFFGYKNLRNTDERFSNSNFIFKLLNNLPVKPPIKFQLTTEFDYKILELVYAHSFSDSDNYSNLNNLNIKNIIREKKTGVNLNSSEYLIIEEILYGKLYQKVTPNDPLSDLITMLTTLPNNIPLLSEFGWYCYKLGVKMKPFSLNDIDFSISSLLKSIGYLKEDFILFIENNKKIIDTEELKVRIRLSQKNKEI